MKEIELVIKEGEGQFVEFKVHRQNPLISDLFSRLEMGERLGTGIKRIRAECRKVKAPLPRFLIKENYFYVTFKPSKEYGQLAGVTPPITPPIDLTGLESKILCLIRSNARISTSVIASRLKVGRDTVKEYTQKLKDKNKLKRHGSARNGYWEVT